MKNLIVSILLFTSLQFAQVVGPRLSLQHSEFDFGNIKQGEEVSHDFVVSNTGGDALIITNVRASCGCTAVKPEKNTLAPGESAKITAKFNTLGRSGNQKKYVYVTSNDKDNPEVRLSFTANIVAEDISNRPKLFIEETNHDFGIVKEGKIVDWSVKIKNTGGSLLEIKDIKTSCGCTAAVLSGRKLNPGETTNLKIEFDTTNKPGKNSKTVTLYSNDPKQPNQTIVITAEVKSGS